MRSPELGLRLAEPTDSELVWRIRNEETARAASLGSEPIPFSDHERWWERRLADPASLIYIATLGDGRPAGYVRFALDGETAEISVAVDPSLRGRGLGAEAIRVASETVLESGVAHRVVAFVKGGNEASLGAFRSAGYVESRRLEVKGVAAVELVRERP